MASRNQSIGSSWEVVQTGEQAGLNIQPNYRPCQIWAGPTLPLETDEGIKINPGDFRTVDVSTGENLYARAVETDTEIVITV